MGVARGWAWRENGIGARMGVHPGGPGVVQRVVGARSSAVIPCST
jgi:hypothetical protein